MCFKTLQSRLLFLIIFVFACACTSSISGADESDRPFLKLHQYKPIYFIAGKPDTKIQFSFKVRLMESFGFYFGFSQLMMWDLTQSSAPIRDINYNPEIFYRLPVTQEIGQWIDFGIFDHESNGRTGVESRSVNRVYLLYRSKLWFGDPTKFFWSVKGWVPYGYRSENNNDYPKYRGVWELQLNLGDFLGPFFGEHDVSLRVYPGGSLYINPVFGGQELTFKCWSKIKKLTPNLVFQVFHGYAENMLEYRENRFGLRAGIGF